MKAESDLKLRVGTRGSPLALRQTDRVIEQLRAVAPGVSCEVHIIRTAGDRNPEAVISELSADGVFVRTLEEALLAGRIDLAVHSLKDLPGALMPALTLAAFLERNDPADALVSEVADSLERLPTGARVGTGSPRRRALLLERRPDLRVVPIRGNVDTRLRKLREGQVDALVLALAGLQRLGLESVVRERLAPDVFVPAPGQGTPTVEVRQDRPDVLALMGQIDHPASRAAAAAERAFLITLAGGCLMPAGVFAAPHGAGLRVVAVLADLDGTHLRREEREGPVDAAPALGAELARSLMAPGRPGAVPPLAGLTVVVTRPRAQAGELATALEKAGARTFSVPAIEILPPPDWSPLDAALGQLDQYRWVTVTSVNGAQALLTRARLYGKISALSGVAVAAVGDATAAALRSAGIKVAVVPAVQRAEGLAGALTDLEGSRVLVVRGDRGRTILAERLRQRGARADEVIAYRTVAVAPAAVDAVLGAAAVDWLVLASGSAAKAVAGWPSEWQARLQPARVACLGPETARAAAAAGLRVAVTAAKPDPAALVHALVRAAAGDVQR
jgi:hydroxymethylbilane synthase